MAGNSVGVKVVSVVFDKTRLVFIKCLFSAYLRQSKLQKNHYFVEKVHIVAQKRRFLIRTVPMRENCII